MRRPVATSTGATADQLEDFLLDQPGVPPLLAQEIRMIGQSALPVPVPSGMTQEHVTLGGSPAAVLLHGPSRGRLRSGLGGRDEVCRTPSAAW